MKILFFSPFAAIWLHALPEALVARALRDNNEILYLACDGELDAGCMAMFAHGITAKSDVKERNKVCSICRQQVKLLTETLGLEPEYMKDYILDEEVSLIEDYLASIRENNLDQFSLGGLPLGRYALHETIIHYKLTDLSEMNDEAFIDARNNLKNVLKVFFAVEHYVSQHNPDCIVTYNTHVSTQYTLLNVCEPKGIKVYGLHAGMNMACRLQSLYVFRQDMRVFYNRMIQRFENDFANAPCDRESLENVSKHFIALTQGKSLFIYSSPVRKDKFDVYSFFSVKREQKILLATMSSYDEYFSSLVLGVTEDVPLLFPTQVDWIRSVIKYVSNHPELFLIIRIHPREFPNKRDSRLSNHAKILKEELTMLPPNVAVNWPTDNVSIYDLAMETDVVLNGWSSAGKEMALLGLPVVIYNSEILYYPGKTLNYLGDTIERYFSRIECALSDGWSFERVVKTFRWLAWEYTYATIDISDGFPYIDVSKPDILSRVWNRFMRIIAPHSKQVRDCKRLNTPVKNSEIFIQSITRDKFVPELQWCRKQSLPEDEERALIRSLLQKMVKESFHGKNADKSKLFQNLNSVINV